MSKCLIQLRLVTLCPPSVTFVGAWAIQGQVSAHYFLKPWPWTWLGSCSLSIRLAWIHHYAGSVHHRDLWKKERERDRERERERDGGWEKSPLSQLAVDYHVLMSFCCYARRDRVSQGSHAQLEPHSILAWSSSQNVLGLIPMCPG